MDQKRMNEFIHSALVSSTQMAYVEEAHGTLMLLENMHEVFRYCTSNLQLVTLYEELEIFRRYIEIHKLRYGDRYSIRFSNESAHKSVYIKHLSLIDSFDDLLCSCLEQTDSPADFRLEFKTDGQQTFMSVITEADGMEYAVEKKLL